jgi:hypothetical protein
VKQNEFEKGDKVVTIKDYTLRKGVVYAVYPLDPPIYAVKFEDGTVEKILHNNIALESDTETPEENEPIEKSEITITPDEFRAIACRVIAEETMRFPLISKIVMPIVVDIHRALFIEPREDENFFN